MIARWINNQGYVLKIINDEFDPPHFFDKDHPKLIGLGVHDVISTPTSFKKPKYNFNTSSWDEIYVSNEPIPQTNDEKISLLWKTFNDYAETQMDTNSRHSINLILVDTNATQNQIDKILVYADWWKLLWYQYSVEKQKILDGGIGELNLSNVGECPYNIWEIATP
jgi:hypothetical protein